MRRRSIDAALDALARTYETTVVDIDSDLDGEALTGSADVGDHQVVGAAQGRGDRGQGLGAQIQGGPTGHGDQGHLATACRIDKLEGHLDTV